MTRAATVYCFALMIAASSISVSAQTSQGGFETMAQPTEEQSECKVPRPPKDLDSFAYIRNGYREIMRIEAYQNSIDTAFCGCPFAEVDWAFVVENNEQYITSDNPKLPFDVIELRSHADSLEAVLDETCER
ncbi:hypothetical protein [Primorskyibacter sp. S87]|uniref:hypothetical protein n=1 Tax=Primorskyibacter sp. S87 TaxID=3415126 RepID=UPI003C7CAFDD